MAPTSQAPTSRGEATKSRLVISTIGNHCRFTIRYMIQMMRAKNPARPAHTSSELAARRGVQERTQ